MKIQLPKKVLEIVEMFQKEGYEIYVVGGAVRDLLMGKAVYDWDFTTNATPEAMLKFIADAFYDNKYGTVGISPDKEGERPLEITTFRTEHGYSDARRPDKVEWGKTLEDDLKRRDFTINAMALQIAKGFRTTDYSKDTGDRLLAVDCKLIDRFDGQRDLKDKLIRAVGDANERFSEDALRMMRAVRIASELGFLIEEKTFDAVKQNASSIGKIARERVRDELLKTLASPHPYDGIILFRNCGLMQEVLPEMEKTFGVEQASPGRHHIYDVGTHSLMSLKNCPSTDPIVRLATLIHDIGKPQTFKKLENGTITFYNHELVSAKIAARIADRLKFSNQQKDKLVKLVRYHQFTLDEKQTDSAIRRFIRNVGPEYINDMLDLRVGDRVGGGAQETSWRLEEFKQRLIEVQKQPFTVRDLKVSGNDVMQLLNIKPGPKVGEILKKLYDDVVEKKIENDKAELLKAVGQLAKNQKGANIN